MKVILINADGEYKQMESNKGAEAVIISTIQILRKCFPNIDIITTIQLSDELSTICKCKEIKNKIFSFKTFSPITSFISTSNFIRTFFWHFLNAKFNVNLKFLITNKKLNEYATSDLIIHLGMDLYSDDFGMRTIIEHSKDILMGVYLNKPVIMWAESIGPFNNKLSSFLAKKTLNAVSMILVRENESFTYLKRLGLKDIPIYITADPAILLNPTNKKIAPDFLNNKNILDNSRPLIGISLSLTYLAGGVKKSKKLGLLKYFSNILLYLLPENLFMELMNFGKKTKTYSESQISFTSIIAQVIDHIIDNFNADVILIPHIQHPIIGELSIHENVYRKVKYQKSVNIISKEYNAQELKEIIGYCDLFIGGRMHANIAALSQGIPTIGLSYSYKFKGIMTQFGQEKYICTNISYYDIIDKFSLVWDQKENIRNNLSVRLPFLKSLSLENGVLLKKFYFSS